MSNILGMSLSLSLKKEFPNSLTLNVIGIQIKSKVHNIMLFIKSLDKHHSMNICICYEHNPKKKKFIITQCSSYS